MFKSLITLRKENKTKNLKTKKLRFKFYQKNPLPTNQANPAKPAANNKTDVFL